MPGPASGSPGSSRRKALSKRSGGSGMAPAYSVTCPCPVKLHTRAVPAGTVDRERPASSFDRIPLLPCPGLARWRRSEEHTSELQSLMRISYAVFCLQTKKHSNQNLTDTEATERQIRQ